MCGIVGMVNGHPVAVDLAAALGRLEYRGHDSAGVALAGPGLPVHRILGRATDLLRMLEAARPEGRAGIGHTRWATHGRPELHNAHPHRHGGVAVVHNGIIENHDALRRQLRDQGHHFASDTDSEVIPHLMAEGLAHGLAPIEALLATCRALEEELGYIRAEGYPSGELKHGPIAVIREGSPVIVCTPGDAGQAKVLANASAVAARGAHLVALTDAAGLEAAEATAAQTITLPGDALTAPFAQAVFLQLLAYHTAVVLRHDVDRPRNLAKSVTVE